MPQIINTNIASLTAQRNLNGSQNSLATSLQRLSTGLRINSAKDDAAGLAISERFTTQIRGLNQAIRNANDGVSFAQTAEGALSTAGDALQRIRELAVQSINDTNSSADRQALNNEVSQLVAEINRISTATQFNGQNILDGSLSTLTFQVGANQGQTIQVSGVDSRGSQLGASFVDGSSVTGTGLGTTLATDDVSVNGVAVDLAGVIAAATPSINDVITQINAVASDSGVTALKQSTVTTPTIAYVAIASGSITVNGVSIALDNVAAGAVEAAINGFSTQTGVTVAQAGGNLTFSNTDGADIIIADGATGVLAANGDDTFSAGIKLVADVGGSITLAGTEITSLGLTAGAQTLTTQTLNGVDVTNSTSANEALLTLDFALSQVSGLRAELGAVQTRFESTISNLSITSENLSAARSRIRDADFAAETAELTRSQILQQAGIAILSQANALPQNVLALLQ